VALKWGYDELRTLIALPDPVARKTLRKTLSAEGLLHCREIAEMPALIDHLGRHDPDLLVVALDEGAWDSAGMIRQIRNGALGHNPFMVVITLLQAPSPALVTRAVNAGTDDLLLQPWLGKLVLDRLDNFAQGRKPFLVTHDYIGPERRGFYREGAPPPPTVEVPNPVQWLSEGNDDRAAFRRKIEQALETVNLRKIKSCGGQLRFLADRVVENFAQGTPERGHEAILPTVRALLEAADEMVRRAADTDFAPAIELTAGLRVLCHRLLRADRAPRAEEISVLPSLADAVVNALYWNEKDPLPAALTR
jgi:CheY-like chemotaxis protein